MRTFLSSFGFALLWVFIAYIAWGTYTRQHYLNAFEKTKQGESLSSVLERFGSPSHIEPHYSGSGYDSGSKSVCGESCWVRLWYEVPFTLGISPVTVDFDVEQKVIHKYEWNSP